MAVAASYEREYLAQAPAVHSESQGSLFGPRLSVGSTGDGLRDDPCLVPRAEISERQIRDLVDLYQQWADEENRPFSLETFIEHVVTCLGNCALIPMILLYGEKPVGACLLTLFRDMFSGKTGCMADQFYILPEYRGLHGGKVMAAACMAFADHLEVDIQRVPARYDKQGYYRNLLPSTFVLDSVVFTKEK